MSTPLAVRATRQTLILAVIGSLHVGAFILVSTNLGEGLSQTLLPNPPFTVSIPPLPTMQTVPPGPMTDPGYNVPVAERPPVEFPPFDEHKNPTRGNEMHSESVAGAGPSAPVADYRPPVLRTRDRRLAALIDACYPAASRRLSEEGRVAARVTIDAAGRPIDWSVEESSGFAHLDSVVDCVIRRLEFIPGRRDGRGVEATVLLPIVFRLD
jgi:protein TonB